jgi:hypothetical protein
LLSRIVPHTISVCGLSNRHFPYDRPIRPSGRERNLRPWLSAMVALPCGRQPPLRWWFDRCLSGNFAPRVRVGTRVPCLQPDRPGMAIAVSIAPEARPRSVAAPPVPSSPTSAATSASCRLTGCGRKSVWSSWKTAAASSRCSTRPCIASARGYGSWPLPKRAGNYRRTSQLQSRQQPARPDPFNHQALPNGASHMAGPAILIPTKASPRQWAQRFAWNPRRALAVSQFEFLSPLVGLGRGADQAHKGRDEHAFLPRACKGIGLGSAKPARS